MPVRFIEIGRIFKPHGLKGDVKIYPSSPDLELFKAPSTFLSAEGEARRELFISGVKAHGKYAIVHFKGFDHIEDVESLSGKVIEVPEDQLPLLPAGEYYQFQVLGLGVYTESGNHLGFVHDIIETGSNDVYEVKGKDGKNFLLPVIKDVILKVSLEEKKIIIRVVEGLLDAD